MKVAAIVASLRRCDTRTNERDNVIHDAWRDSERYEVDFAEDFTSEGWEQVDTNQDAHYFGFWVNRSQLLTLTYCEGDWSLVVCADAEHYEAELKNAFEFYTPGAFAITIDGDGTVTKHFEDRQKHLVGTCGEGESRT